jgi:endonuclease-8
MEGPSLIILKEELSPFVGQKITAVSGNTKIEKERLKGKVISAINSWGKHLLISTEDFTLKVHFLMYGSYRINAKKEQTPRLQLKFKKGEINLYSCSVSFIESELKDVYDWGQDVMSDAWDQKSALKAFKERPNEFLCDILLDQALFAGVGNIIKNEVLFLMRLHPLERAGNLSAAQKTKLLETTRAYCFKFLKWKKAYVLKKNWKIYRKRHCPVCATKTTMKKTGKLERISFFCSFCQKEKKERSKRA